MTPPPPLLTLHPHYWPHPPPPPTALLPPPPPPPPPSAAPISPRCTPPPVASYWPSQPLAGRLRAIRPTLVGYVLIVSTDSICYMGKFSWWTICVVDEHLVDEQCNWEKSLHVKFCISFLFNSRRQPLSRCYLCALLFLRFKKFQLCWGAVFLHTRRGASVFLRIFFTGSTIRSDGVLTSKRKFVKLPCKLVFWAR